MKISAKQSQLDWRRRQVIDLASKGWSQIEISRQLQISKTSICRDFAFLKYEARKNIRKYVDETLPIQYDMAIEGLTSILKEAWIMSSEPDIDRREKLAALNLAKEVYLAKLDLLTAGGIIDNAVKLINNNKLERMNGSKKEIYNYNIIKGKEEQQQEVKIEYTNTNTNTEEHGNNEFSCSSTDDISSATDIEHEVF